MRAVRVSLIILLLFNLVPINQVFANEELINLFAVDDPKEPFQEGEVVMQPKTEMSAPDVNLRPTGFKEYVYDTGIWYGVQWGARLYWVRDKSLKIFNTSFTKWWDNITEKPEWDDGDTFVVNWVAHPFLECCHTSSIGPAGMIDGHLLLDLSFKASFLSMQLKVLLYSFLFMT
jgi:hypothetical protein